MGWLLDPRDTQLSGGSTSGMKQGGQYTDLEARLATHKNVMICVAAALVGPADAEDAALVG
jgi:hypothetical protein